MKKTCRIINGLLAVLLIASLLTVPVMAQGATWPDMGPSPIATETVGAFERSIRDPNIRPEKILQLTSDNELLNRAFATSVEYSYDELIVGPQQFPLSDKDNRITKHFEGTGNYTSTAIPCIWGTYHGIPGQSGYRECFCARDIAHTAEAGSLLSMNEENWQMMTRFADESSDLYWRETDHNAYTPWRAKSFNQRYWTLWSFDNYGDAYYMDASFQELPAPFELMDKIWTQYRWTGDSRWIDDSMMNFAMQLHSYDKFMKYSDFDGDGLADNGHDGGVLPTLYEFEASGFLQEEDVEWKYVDKTTGDLQYPLEAQLVIKPSFFTQHTFNELPLRLKLVGRENNNDITQGEADFTVRLTDRAVENGTPMVLKTFDRLSTRNNWAKARNVEIPLYLPTGKTFELYDSINKLQQGTDYTVTASGTEYPIISVAKDYFDRAYHQQGINKLDVGLVVRFNDGSDGTVIVKLTDYIIAENATLNVTQIHKNSLDVTNSLEKDLDTQVVYLDYSESELETTEYTFTIQYKNSVEAKKATARDLKDYCSISSELTRVVTAGDTVGTQYQALLATANMIRSRIALGGEYATFQPYHLEKGVKVPEGAPITLTESLAVEYDARAQKILDVVEARWRDSSVPQEYARALNKLNEKDLGWGRENSFFMPMKELLAPGQPTQNYLNFIQKNAVMNSDALNEEAITYMPESFYMHGQNISGWQWTKVGLNRLDPAIRDYDTQIMGTYPEIALMNIFNVVGLMMGVEPTAATDSVTTLPRLTSEVGWAEVKNIPLGQTGRDPLEWNGFDSDGNPRASAYSKPKVHGMFDLKHYSTKQTTFTNTGAQDINWRAEFYGNFPMLYLTLEGGSTQTITNGVGHNSVVPASTWLEVTVAPGETVTVGTQETLLTSPENTEGQLYLSDQQTAFENTPKGFPLQLDQTVKGTALYNWDFTLGYAKGLGAKPDSTLRYLLPEGSTEFRAIPTLNDFERGKDPQQTSAQVVFKVYVDGVLMSTETLNKSKITGDEIQLTLPQGATTLDLVVLNPSKSSLNENAAWLNARILVEGVNDLPNELPDTNLYLTNLPAKNAQGTIAYDSSTNNGASIKMDGRVLQKGIGTNGATQVEYDLSGLYKSLDLTLGYQDGVTGETKFSLYLNDEALPILEKTISSDEVWSGIVDLKIDETCAQKIRLVTTRIDGKNQSHANWGDLVLTLDGNVDLSDPEIIARRISKIENVKLLQTNYNLPNIPVNNPDDYSIEIYSSSNTEILDLDGTVTANDNDHLLKVSFKITETTGAQRHAITREFDVFVPHSDKITLTRIDWLDRISENGIPAINTDAEGKTIRIDDVDYSRGLGLPASPKGEFIYSLENGLYKRFTATVGAAQNSGYNGNSFFRIFVMGIDSAGKRTELYASPVMAKGPYESNSHLNCGQCQPIIDRYGFATSEVVDIDLPVNFDKVAIYAERIGDSFWGQGAIGEPYFYSSSPYEGQTITALDDVTVQTVKGNAPALPNTTKATYEGIEEKRSVQVKWDAIDPEKYAAIGEFEVLGTVDGTTIKAKCLVKVRDKIVASAANVIVVTTVGEAPELPVKVAVKYNDGSNGEEPAIWETFADEKWQLPGNFAVNGTIEGTDIKVICNVRVDDPNEILLATIVPEKSEALESVQKGTYTLNGTSYPDSIFAHAKSDLVYVLGGKYTRFTTTVGIKQTGDNPNVLFRGYGIGADGTETLLYETTSVSRVVDPSVEPKTAEKTTGYYYVGGNVSYNVDVDVTGFEKIRLVADDVGNANTDHSVYGTPRLYTPSSPMGKNFHTITVTSGSGGALWPNGRVVVPNGESKTFFITPAPENTLRPDLNVKGMRVERLALDELSQTVEDNLFLLENVTENHTLHTTFVDQSVVPELEYTVTVTNGTGSGLYSEGVEVTVEATVPAGQSFDGWQVTSIELEEEQLATTPLQFNMPANDVAITALLQLISELGNLQPEVSSGDGLVTLTAQSGESNESFYYKTALSSDVDNKPEVDSENLGEWTLFEEDIEIEAENDVEIFVQVIQVVDGKIKAWGEASAIPSQALPDTYLLTVTGGTPSSGYYGEDDSVSVTATIPAGQKFVSWQTADLELDDEQLKANPLDFVMPANTVSLVAQFEDIEEPTYALTVVDGTGAGSYEEGEEVSITASEAPVGKMFDKWTTVGGGSFADATMETTTFTMPGNAATITATYKDKPVIGDPTYALTVVSGTGTGSYEEGEEVNITANEAPVGKMFDKWTTTSGSFGDATNGATTFTMPANAATVTATYKDKPVIEEPTYVLTVVDGTGTGSYEEGEEVSITANEAPVGKMFDKWTTSGGGSFADATSGTTTFTMPGNVATITAIYKDKPVIEEPTYALTVVSGTGAGSYEAGAVVNITANAAPVGKMFDKWTTTSGSVADATSAATTFTMPGNIATVTATYKDKPVIEEPTYALTVADGTGTGSYEAGAVVNITANAAPVGKMFDKWTTTSGSVADATNETTTFTMSGNIATVTATYKDKPVIEEPTYALTVVSGTGIGSYEAGEEVNITANAAPVGKVFDKWTTVGGGSFADATNKTTTFTMPANAATVTATYKDKPVIEEPIYALTVVSGTGTGSYEEGEVVNITANAAPVGKVFDKWTVSGGSVGNAISAATTFTMPANAATVTATYKDKPVIEEPTYALTVVSGTGTGSYEEGEVVNITANEAPVGKVFDKWTVSGGSVADATNAATTFTMPANAATVTATYKTEPITVDPGGNTGNLVVSPGSGGRGSGGGMSISLNPPAKATASGKLETPYKSGETIVGKETIANGAPATTVISMAPKAIAKDNPAVAGSKAGEETKYTLENFKKDVTVAQNGNKEVVNVVIKAVNYSGITKEVLDAANEIAREQGIAVAIQFDRMKGNVVTSRTYVKLGANNVSLDLLFDTDKAGKIKALFNKHFSNNLMVLCSDPTGSKTDLAMKLEAGLSADDLVVYVYDDVTNQYTKAVGTNASVDKNGYLHITVPQGTVIISDGSLAKK